MHTFQDMPADLIERDPFTDFGVDGALLTSGVGERVNAMTITWGMMGVLFNMNVVTVFVEDSRYTKELMDWSGVFSISFFEGKQKSLLKYFDKVSGRRENKFATSGLTVNEHKGIPFVDDCSFAIVCRLVCRTKIKEEDIIDSDVIAKLYSGENKGNTHTMYVGEIVDFLAR